MKKLLYFLLTTIILGLSSEASMAQEKTKTYVCPPCGCSEDGKELHIAGTCSGCGMTLINKDDPSEGLNYVDTPPETVCNMIANNSELLILDVRSTGEYNGRTTNIGRFKKALNIPINELESRLDELEAYKNKEILVYCSISMRSPRASTLLANNGFTKVHNLLGGLNNWNAQKTSEVPCKNSVIERQ